MHAEPAYQRRAAIRRRLEMWGRVSTSDLVGRFGVSERTVQRDLDRLADEVPEARRVHGGLVTAAPDTASPPLRIGMLVPSDRYFTEVIAGAKAAADGLNVRLVLGSYLFREDLESDALERLGEASVDGLIVAVRYDSYGYERLVSLGLTTVVIERPWHPGRFRVSTDHGIVPIDHVCSDHDAGAGIGLRHLIDLGHREILCLVRMTPTSVGLLRGLKQAIADLPRSCRVDIVQVPLEHGSTDLRHDVVVRHVVERCRSGAVTAVFAHADPQAVAVHRGLAEAGLAVPDQVSVLGYDDVIAEVRAELSAVSPRRHWIGTIAMETVVDRLRSRGLRPHGQRPSYQVSLVPELVQRASTAPPPDRRC